MYSMAFLRVHGDLCRFGDSFRCGSANSIFLDYEYADMYVIPVGNGDTAWIIKQGTSFSANPISVTRSNHSEEMF